MLKKIAWDSITIYYTIHQCAVQRLVFACTVLVDVEKAIHLPLRFTAELYV
jgi:hypothetical protein